MAVSLRLRGPPREGAPGDPGGLGGGVSGQEEPSAKTQGHLSLEELFSNALCSTPNSLPPAPSLHRDPLSHRLLQPTTSPSRNIPGASPGAPTSALLARRL